MVSNQPWLSTDAIIVLGAQHPLPNHLEKLLPKFDPNYDVLPEDHIKQFMLSLRLLNVEHTDVMCKLFPYIFQGKASTWFFSLASSSINSWKQFDKTFMTQFGDDKTEGILFLELSRINISKKEMVKDFNKIFITLLNRIPNKPAEVIQIEFYIVSLPPPVAMFVKIKEKQTLAENFQ
jgi:hypothetical protein